MLDLVQRYYAGERTTALLGLGVGIAMLLTSGVLWRASAAPGLARGMAYALIVAGVLQSAASGSYVAVVAKRATTAAQEYSALNQQVVAERETTRMQGVLASGYTGALAFNTLLIVAGLVLVFASSAASTRKGVALALMVVGVLGHCFEAFSMQKNREHLARVEALGR